MQTRQFISGIEYTVVIGNHVLATGESITFDYASKQVLVKGRESGWINCALAEEISKGVVFANEDIPSNEQYLITIRPLSERAPYFITAKGYSAFPTEARIFSSIEECKTFISAQNPVDMEFNIRFRSTYFTT